MKQFYPLSTFLTEYSEKNGGNAYRPVAVGRYGIRTRESIYSKELAKDYSKNKLIHKNTLTVGMGSVQIDIGVLTDDITYSVSPAYHTYKIAGVNAEYLRYCLECRNQDMFSRFVKRGSRQGKTIDLKRWLTYEIPVYDENRQQEIVDRLNRISELIEKRQEQLVQLSELMKSRFIELFGDPDGNPMNWETAELERHLEIVGGFAFKSEGFTESGIPVLRIGNINSGHFLPVNMVFWPEDPSLARYKMYPGDLVMSLTGTVGKDDYGNVCVLSDEYPEYYLNQRNAKLAIGATLNRHYLSEMLKFSRIKKRLTGISRGVRQANISNRDILALRVPIPPIELQEQFATFVEQTDKSKLAVQKGLQELEILKKSLMQQYFG